MKKYLSKVLILSLCVGLSACGKKNVPEKMMLGGVEYDSDFVLSGYYFDKASLSDATLAEMLEKVEVIEKPKDLGTCTLPDLSKIELMNNPEVEVTDQLIEAELEKERDRELVYVPVKTKREAKMGDKLIIDYKGFLDGVAFDGGEASDVEIVLGDGGYVPGFEEGIVGHKAGSKFTINVTFPDEYDPALAGKATTFDISIKSIEEPNTPEINEEFVKKHTMKNSTTVEAYREEIRERIKERNTLLNKQNLSNQLIEKLFDECTFDPNEKALAWMFSGVINQYKMQAAQSGMTLSDMFSYGGGTLSDTFEEIKSSMPDYIKEPMIIQTLIDKYNIKLTEEEVKKCFMSIAELVYGPEISYDDIKKYYGYENIEATAKQFYAFEKATNDCKIVDYKEDEQQ